MKKTLKTMFLVALAIVAMGSIYAETFEKVELLDKFGDSTGEFYVQAKNDFEGSYNIEGGATNAKLKWNFELYENEVKFILKEKGYTENLSAARFTTDEFTIDVKYESGDIISYYGTVARGNEGNYNCISVTSYIDDSWIWRNLPEDLKSGGVCKIVISNDHGTYNLGAVDVTEIERMFYDVDTYNEIMNVFGSGDYAKALNMIDSFKAADAVAYDHFDLRFFEIESFYGMMCVYLSEGDYEVVLESIEIFRTLYWSNNVFVDNPLEDSIVKLQYYAIHGLYNAGKYEAVKKGIEDFKVAYWNYSEKPLKDLIIEIEYQIVVALYEEGKYEEAIAEMQVYANYYGGLTEKLNELREDCLKNLGIYLVGYTGPAGGYIFYDVDADNDSGNKDGLISTECGWRFLEAAPADLRVVNGVSTVDSSVDGYSSAPEEYVFGYYKSANGNKLYVNGTTSYKKADCTSNAIGSGKSNTEKHVSAMGDIAYQYNGGIYQYAAKLCNDLEYNGFDDWFLPSRDELGKMYDNLKAKGMGSFSASYYWSSSESSYDANYAWSQAFSDGYQYATDSRSYDYSIRPCRAF